MNRISIKRGETLQFVTLVGRFINGTATASQVINFVYRPVYGWE